MANEVPKGEESSVYEACAAGDANRATSATLSLYGGEIFGYLLAVSRSEDASWDIFQQFCLDLWQGLPSFAWRCSLRTWAYTLARNAALRYVRRAYHHRESPLESQQVRNLAASLRSTVPAHLRASNHAWLERARQELSLDDQTLLTLRVDRRMEFKEIAEVLSDGDEALNPVALRKRYERLKKRLRELAARDGRLAG